MELRRLRYFLVLAEELHFGRAAQRLHLAQPGLSQQIKVLEREVGAPLLDRGPHGVRLTAAGRVLVERGRTLLNSVDHIVEDVHLAGEGNDGLVKFAHTRSIRGDSDDIIEEFQKECPRAELSIQTAWTARNIEMLQAAQIDAAFVRLPLVNAEGLRVMPMGSSELAIAAPCGHRLAERQSVAISDLHGAAMVAWPREQAPGYFDYLESQFWGPEGGRVVRWEPDTERMLVAVAHGVGLCLIDVLRAQQLRPRGVVIRRFTPRISSPWAVAWSPQALTPALDALLRVCAARRRIDELEPAAQDGGDYAMGR